MAANPPLSVLRTGAPFTFHGSSAGQFVPGAGTRLHFGNRDVDTLTLVGVPSGVVSRTETVAVKYLGTTVFRGSVESVVDEYARGDDRRQTIVCHGPWGALSRLVFRQTWHASPTVTYTSARVVLNQSSTGLAQSMTDTLREICQFASSKCGFAYSSGDVSASSIVLPADETRDITCADAIRRELRFFPRKVVRFDYSRAQPAIVISDPSTSSDASYVSSVPRSSRRYEYTAHPIRGVDVYTSDGDMNAAGTEWTQNHQFYGAAGVSRDDIDVLHVYVPLAPGTSSTDFESLDVTTEQIGSVNGVSNEREWWRTKHPRLHDVPNAALQITDFGYSRPSFSPVNITDCTVGALRKFGLQAEVVRFHCNAKITTQDDVEESIYLTMDFVCTNATTRTYTQQVGSSSTAAETIPEGLAQALYNQRPGALKNEYMTVRLGDSLPTIGDAADGLVLQEYDVDCIGLTADLHFGQPEYLSAEDMRSLLNGFRQRGYASNSVLRGTGEADDEDAVEFAGVQPVSSTEFQPGTKSKMTIKASSGGGSIVLDSSDVDAGKTIGVHDLTYTPSGANEATTVKILAEGDVTIPPGGGGGGAATCDAVTGISFAFENNILKATLTKRRLSVNGNSAAGSASVSLPIMKGNVVIQSVYDADGDHRFVNRTKEGLIVSGQSQPTEEEVFEAVRHTSGMDG